jgi:hypothetical protein
MPGCAKLYEGLDEPSGLGALVHGFTYLAGGIFSKLRDAQSRIIRVWMVGAPLGQEGQDANMRTLGSVGLHFRTRQMSARRRQRSVLEAELAQFNPSPWPDYTLGAEIDP